MICGLVLPPIQNPGYAYALNHVQYAYQIPVSSIRCAKTIRFGVFGVWGVGCLGCGMFGDWGVWGVGCLGCLQN